MNKPPSESGHRRNIRVAREERLQTRVRDTRERLIDFFTRANVEEARITGRASNWSIAAAALREEVIPRVDPERRTWFAEHLRAVVCSEASDLLTRRLLSQILDDLAVGLAYAGTFEQLGDLAERLGEMIADALPTQGAAPEGA
jgi:hypothetical protein